MSHPPSPPARTPPHGPDRLPSCATAARLVDLLRAERREPIDDLLEALLLAGSAWGVLRRGPDGAGGGGGAGAGAVPERLPPPGRSLEQLAAAKTRARDAFGSAPAQAARDAALLRYLVAVAEAIVRHGRNLSSLPADDLAGWLEAAAEAMSGAERSHAGREDAQLALLFRGAAATLDQEVAAGSGTGHAGTRVR